MKPPVAFGRIVSILDVFNEHGVAIMTPACVADPEQPKIVPREDWYLAPATPPAAAPGAPPGAAP